MEIRVIAPAAGQGKVDLTTNTTVAFLGPFNSYSHQV
jgi:hypothetical protein